MGAIAPSRLAVLALVFVTSLTAQQSKAIYQQVARVGTALSARDAEGAMAPFDKTFDGFGRLRDYFSALTNGYNITNDLEVATEQIVNHEATLTIHWIMTLSDLQSSLSETREKDLTVKLTMEKYDWKIVSVAPLEFFDPALRPSK